MREAVQMSETMPADEALAANRNSVRIAGLWRLLPSLRDVLFALLVAAAYYGGTKLGLALTPPDHPISTLWPPNALLLAALLLAPTRRWPIFLLAVLPAHLFLQLHSGIPALTAFGWFATNTGEALLGAACIRAFFKPSEPLFDSFRGVLAFVVFGVLLATVVTSFLDATVVVLTGFGSNYWTLFRMRLFSNMLATLTLVPPIVVLGTGGFARLKRETMSRFLEAAVLAGGLVIIVGFVFGALAPSSHSVPALLYLLLPLLLWAAVRFGTAGVSTSLLIVALLSIFNVIHDRGPFGGGPLSEEVLSLQIFLSVINVPLLCLAAGLQERESVQQELQQNENHLKLISEIAANFINVRWEEIDSELQRSLEQVRRHFKVDRASLFDFEENKGFTLRYSVVKPELKMEIAPAYISTEQVPWSMPKLRLGETVLIDDLKQLPDTAGEKKTFGHRPVCSAAVVPLCTKGSLAGVITLVSLVVLKNWPRELIPHFKILAEIFYDVLQRKHAMQALAESEQRFRHTADSAPMLVWMSGTDRLVTYFNHGWLEFTGRKLEDELGEGWAEDIHPEDIEACLFSYHHAFDARQPFRMEYRLRRHDGVYRWMLDIGVPRFDAERTFLGYIGSCVDITERKNAEEAVLSFSGKLLNAQEEERRRIARELHDDVGQRLALLTIELDKLRNSPRTSLQADASSLWSQSTDIANIVRQISHNLHASGLDLLGLPAALASLCREFPQNEPINIKFSHENVPSNVRPEIKLCFYRVVQEALQNVSKHSHARGVDIELKARDGELKLLIMDDGIGFAANKGPILGLGLASMRERLKSIGGSIKVNSGPTRGTTIEASAPLSGPSASG